MPYQIERGCKELLGLASLMERPRRERMLQRLQDLVAYYAGPASPRVSDLSSFRVGSVLRKDSVPSGGIPSSQPVHLHENEVYTHGEYWNANTVTSKKQGPKAIEGPRKRLRGDRRLHAKLQAT